jgi:hypothetical protein
MTVARTCYDHLAGRIGVAVCDALIGTGALGPGYELTEPGAARLASIGVDVDRARHSHRVFAKACVDYTERRPHLAGALTSPV